MSSNKPGGWRGKTPQGGTARPGAPKPAGWAQKPGQPQAAAGRWHRLKIAAWLLLTAALVVGFLVYLMFRPLRTPLIVAAVTQYAAPFPPNGWAKEDADRLGLLDQQEVVACTPVVWESKEQGLLALRERLDAVRPGGPGKDVVILYLSMHGMVDGDGEPCLVPPGASWADSRAWLRVRDLLDALFLKERAGRPSDRVHKLLVLDAGRIPSDWSLGVLHNDFAGRLRQVVEDLKVPGLSVLNAAGPAQAAGTSPELGGSVFGSFFVRGLQGEADAGQGDGDGKVSLQELHRYLVAQVGQWTVENRADTQTPVLVPADADVPLVYARSRSQPVEDQPAPQPDPRWGDVAKLWIRHAELLAKTPYRRDPLAWEEYQHKLLRLEQLLQAGPAYDDQFRQTKAELGALADALAAQSAPLRLPAYSLPLAARFGQWTQAEADPKTLPGPWQKPPQQPEAPEGKTQGKADPSKQSAEKPEAEKPALTEKPAKTEKPAGEKPPGGAAPKAPASKPPAAEAPKYAYLPAAAAAWQWCAESSTKDRLAQAMPFLAAAQRRPKADVVEARFLRTLAAHLDWGGGAPLRLPQAMTARRLAEEAAAPRDLRAQFVLRALADAADAERRAAEDKLLVGTDAALSEADAAWAAALGAEGPPAGYRGAVRAAERTAAAFALRDRAWAETPYLGQWLLARLRSDPKTPADGLRDLIGATQTLAAELDKSVAAGARTPELDAAQDRVQTLLAALEKAVADESYRLRITAGEDQETLRAIGELLAAPLVTGEDRNRLREKCLRIARTRSSAPASPAAGAAQAPGTGAAAEAEARLAKLLEQWGEHPALTLLGQAAAGAGGTSGGTARPPQPGARPAPLAAQGQAVRELLASVAARGAGLLEQTRKAQEADEKTPQAPAAVRAGCSRADLLVRAAAPLVGTRLWDDPRLDPVRRLEDLDLATLLLWHARRAIDDFYGPAAEGEAPLFQTVAEDYLASARDLLGRKAALRWGETSLPELLAARGRAATAGLRPRVDDLLVSEDEPFLAHKAAVPVPQDLPGGTAAFFVAMPNAETLPLRAGDVPQPAVRRLPLPTQPPAEAAALVYAVANRPHLIETRTLQADVLFRGHAWRSDFYVQPARGLDIVYERPKYPPPTVTVHGQARQQVSVVFILDCSGSMMRRLGGDENKPRRMEAARGALEAILLRLVGPDNPFRVGVLVYGDRCGWNPEEGKNDQMVVPDPANPGRLIPAPPDFPYHPSADVHPLQSVVPFTEKVRKELNGQLDALSPLGETPLYLAIIRGIDMLRAEPRENRRHVVVLTDGFNDQSAGGPPEARKFRKDVEDSLALPQNQGVQLDIVTFEVTANTAEEKQSLQDLTDVSEKRTGGGFYLATDPSSLLKAFEKSLGLVQYAVEPLQAQRGGSSPPTELGRTVAVEPPPDRKTGYRVKLLDPERPADAQIELEGGEAIQLYLVSTRQARRLVHRRYGEALSENLRADAQDIAAPGDPGRKFYVGVHLPEWQGRAVRFPVSVQNGDAEQFSPRPAEAWVEITPVLPGGKTAPPYIFYDLTFESDRPVPVLSCLAPNWPPEARLAQVRLWFSLTRTPPDLGIALGKLARESPVLEGAPEVRFTAQVREPEKADDPLQVIVVERHAPGSRLDAVRVEMAPPPQRTLHRYQPEIGTVRHVFYYDSALAEQVSNYRVLLTARKHLAERAAALPEPLEVAIPRVVVAPGG